MPSATETTSANLVPTVDISAYLADPKSAAADKIISTIRSACLTTGFFQITGHGIAVETQRGIIEAGKKFFALDFEQKKKLDATTTVGHRGYDVLGTQSYVEGVLPDFKEGFYVGEEIPADDPRVVARRFFMGGNVWPPASLISEKDLKEPTMAYYNAVYQLSLTVLELIARTLPYGPHVFDEFIANNPAAPLRILHYPPAKQTEKPQFGSSAHTDFGAITLLFQADNPGLQVQNNVTGEWMPVPPNSAGYVVNVGDMLSKWTGGEYKSSVHRVLNQNPTDRYSVVFFFDGNLDCSLAPLDGSEAEGGVLTVEGHMIKRMTESYGKK